MTASRIARIAFVVVMVLGVGAPATARADDELATLRAAFRDRTGVELVFVRSGLPRGHWFPIMPTLDEAAAIDTARLLLTEARQYPRGWLGASGLRTVGVFAALAADHDDGYRQWDERFGGYTYTGLWNGKDAVALAAYDPWQLVQTFHHEVHHAIDTSDGFGKDDARFVAAIAGERPYPALALTPADHAALEAIAGWPLYDAATWYAAKTPGEDQAETAAWFHGNLATGLLQVADHPEWPGSQRILHLLAEYRAARRPGPATAWWVDVALGRDADLRAAQRALIDGAAASLAQACRRLAPGGRFAIGDPARLRVELAAIDQRVRGLARAADRARLGDAARLTLARRWLRLLDGYRDAVGRRRGLSDGDAAAFAEVRAAIAGALGARVAAATAPGSGGV